MNKYIRVFVPALICAAAVVLGMTSASAEDPPSPRTFTVPQATGSPTQNTPVTGTPTTVATSTSTPVLPASGTPTSTPTNPPADTFTATPTNTSTNVSTGTPGPTYEYTYTLSSCASIVPGTDDTGNHCDDCTTDIGLPFDFPFYDFPLYEPGAQPYRSRVGPDGWRIMRLSSKGIAQFVSAYMDGSGGPGSPLSDPNVCLPAPGYSYTIFAHWDDLRTDCVGCGIFTSTSGIMPNRIFNIEWRTQYNLGGGSANFEVRLYEGQTRLDLIYGTVGQSGSGATVGVQRDAASQFTQVLCNTASIAPGLMVTLARQAYASPTPTATGTPASPTPTPTYPPACASYTATPTSTACPAQFTDVPPDSTFYPYVRCLACRAIVSGYNDPGQCPTGVPCFRPENGATRGQIAKIVSNAAGFNEPHSEVVFTDVPIAHTFYPYIQRLYSRGAVSGYNDAGHCPMGAPCFLPNNGVTRGQLAKIDSIAGNVVDPVPPMTQSFTDVPPNSTFWLFVERLYLRGIVSGYNDAGHCHMGSPCFLPNDGVTRGQSAKIVANTFLPACITPTGLAVQHGIFRVSAKVHLPTLQSLR